MKKQLTTRTKYKTRVQLLNTHQIPFEASYINEVVTVMLADSTTLYVSLKPHYNEAREVGFLHRLYASEEWTLTTNGDFLTWLRSRLELPQQLEDTGVRLPFGKYKGALAQDVVKRDPAYLDWMVSKSFLADSKKDYLVQLLEEAGHDVTDYEPAQLFTYHQLSELIKAAGAGAKVKFIKDETRILLEDSYKNSYQYYQLDQLGYDRLLDAVRPARRGGKAKLLYTQLEASAALDVQERIKKIKLLVS
jgi:uncharacterized protein (DUF3820 family)